MSKFYTPEQALSELLRYLNDDVLNDIEYKEVIPAGSVPLGLYVDERPDLDVFIVVDTDEQIPVIFQTLKHNKTFRKGLIKEGELSIWYVKDYKGYPLDLVVISRENEKVQTLNHVKYYREIMTVDLAKRIRWLKKFFKDINCYSAEIGGITGICCTRMGELFSDTRTLFGDLVTELIIEGKYFVEDPTLKNRNLFASVRGLKKRIMIKEITRFLHDLEYGVDLHTFFEDYRRVYKIKRKKNEGTDREWQFLYSCVKKTWREMKNDIKAWNVKLEYDTIVTSYDMYLGIKIDPDIIEYVAFDYIPMHVLKEKDILNLKTKGAYESDDKMTLVYPRHPPFKNVSREFEGKLLKKLHERYTNIERE